MSITPKPSGNIINSYEGNTAEIIHRDDGRMWFSLAITNNGSGDLIFVVHGNYITVSPGETFDDDFEDFNSIDIRSNQAYRLICRG